MNLRRLLLLPALSCVLFLGACSVLKPVESSEKVSVLLEEQLASKQCVVLAETRVQTLAKILFFPRSQEAIIDELVTLAKNQAVALKGNVLVQISPILDGATDFRIFHCQR